MMRIDMTFAGIYSVCCVIAVLVGMFFIDRNRD